MCGEKIPVEGGLQRQSHNSHLKMGGGGEKTVYKKI